MTEASETREERPAPQTYGERFERALVYAARLHRDQRRKASEVPYVTHLLAVAGLVGEAGGDEDEVVAGLLHDAVEDQGGPPVLAEIRERFGDRVALIVDGCTDGWGDPKPPWKERKLAFLRKLEDAPPPVRLVVCADKIHNARSTLAELRLEGGVVWERFTGRRDGTLWYYRRVVEILRQGGSVPAFLLDDLGRLLDELERHPDPG